MPKWKYDLTDEGIKFSCNMTYRGEIITKEIPDEKKAELASVLTKIINAYIKDKE